ncbi:Vgb family protein [Streptomyces sp. BA2]|uniref:Vgb family protein n=1 Tax=Streptomyces sp. BA2 TaxID=436595 RepID=UPI0013254F18|nr:hypothetical protein [Streptomyces sp. BA2]MWA07945.1 hypothetical protein [Streptomyces sp. BA2]
MAKQWTSPISTGLSSSNCVALDGSGYAYVVGDVAGAVYKVNLETGSNGGGPLATVPGSRGLAVDLDGSLYVVSHSAAALYRVSPAGAVQDPPIATSLGSGSHSVALDGNGNAYVTSSSGLLRVPLAGGQPERVATGFGNATGVALDGHGYAYVTNYENGNLYKVKLSDGHYDSPFATGLPRGANLALDADGYAYIVTGYAGTLASVRTDGAPPVSTLATGLSNAQGVAIDGYRNLWVLAGEGTLKLFAEAAKSAPIGAPTIAAPLPDAQAGPYIKFKGAAPLDSAPPHTTTATAIIAQKPDGTNIGSQIVAKDGYWAWALGEDALHVATPEASHAPASDRGLPWDPGQHTIQFVTHNNLGYSAPTPITFTTPQT